VIRLWHPQYLHYRYRIRALKEPFGLLGGTDQAKLILRKDRAGALSSDLLHGLGRMHSRDFTYTSSSLYFPSQSGVSRFDASMSRSEPIAEHCAA
jgi:glycine betaine/proline transport system substrate-binding protein